MPILHCGIYPPPGRGYYGDFFFLLKDGHIKLTPKRYNANINHNILYKSMSQLPSSAKRYAPRETINKILYYFIRLLIHNIMLLFNWYKPYFIRRLLWPTFGGSEVDIWKFWYQLYLYTHGGDWIFDVPWSLSEFLSERKLVVIWPSSP